ncbi:MAG: hypothetical protein ISR96_01250 [Nitrospira sp.]|nr:hypothetical protein [Nitrospira sp.]
MRNTLVYIVLGIILSIVFHFSLIVAADFVFVQDIRNQAIDDMLASGELSLDEFSSTFDLNQLELDIPGHVYVLSISANLIYWIFLGWFLALKFIPTLGKTSMIIPLVTGLITGNPVYLIFIAIFYISYSHFKRPIVS